jgi:hypothetical protein
LINANAIGSSLQSPIIVSQIYNVLLESGKNHV